MTILTQKQIDQLLHNGSATEREKDHIPVIMLYLPESSATWILTELDPEEPEIAFGLCDLGFGYPELGYVSLKELEKVRGPVFKTIIVASDSFEPRHPLSVYAEAARQYQSTVWNPHVLDEIAKELSEKAKVKPPQPRLE